MARTVTLMTRPQLEEIADMLRKFARPEEPGKYHVRNVRERIARAERAVHDLDAILANEGKAAFSLEVL